MIRACAPNTARDSLILAVIIAALTVCSIAADSEAGAESGDCAASQQQG